MRIPDAIWEVIKELVRMNDDPDPIERLLARMVIFSGSLFVVLFVFMPPLLALMLFMFDLFALLAFPATHY